MNCFGAVGFLNNVSDSRDDKRAIKSKFRGDILAARQADDTVQSFVFMCNVDLAPAEVDELKTFGSDHGFAHVDVYWRERLRLVLDSPEGLGFRYQYLDIVLSDAEQTAFFSRYGKDLEKLLTGRLDGVEHRLNELDFSLWKRDLIRSIELEVQFTGYFESRCLAPEHFRVALELVGTYHEKRGMILGCRDDFWSGGQDRLYFGTKQFFWREGHGDLAKSWLSQPVRAGGGLIDRVSMGVAWRPVSNMYGSELDGLFRRFVLSENLVQRISKIMLTVDDFVLLDWDFDPDRLEARGPSLGWPQELTDEERVVEWRSVDLLPMMLGRTCRRRTDC